jgi:hypothetical protein
MSITQTVRGYLVAWTHKERLSRMTVGVRIPACEDLRSQVDEAKLHTRLLQTLNSEVRSARSDSSGDAAKIDGPPHERRR